VDAGSFHTRLFGVVYVICGDFHDGSEKGTASVHQILCQSWEKSLTMIQQAFGDQILSHTQVFQWHARFKTGHTSVDDDEHTGRPASCTTPEIVARIQQLAHQDQCQTIHDIAEEVGIGCGTCQWVLTKELAMHHVRAKFMPRILTADQKQQCIDVCHSVFLVKHKMAVIPHQPYFPDLAPYDFFLFPKIKLKLKGRRFDIIEEIQAESQRVLDTVTEKDFQEAFQKWRRWWDQWLQAGGNYFEGDGGQ
jgi:hypothetical protein